MLGFGLKQYQIDWLRSPQYRVDDDGKVVATTSTLLKSRRIGGTFATSLKIILGACGIDPATMTDCEPMDYYFASATHRQSKEVIEECADIAKQLCEVDARFEHKASKLSINFTHANTRICAIPASPRAIRGSTGGLVLDEVCFMQDFGAIWKAAKAVAFSNIKNPTGLPVFVLSTPWAAGTIQHEILTGHGGAYKNFIRHYVSYTDALSQGFPGPSPEAVIEDFGEDAYMVEFMLEWLTMGVTFFPMVLLDKAKCDIVQDEELDANSLSKLISKRAIRQSDISGAPRYWGIDLGVTHDLSCLSEFAKTEKGDILINQTVIRGIPSHEQGKKIISVIEAADGETFKVRVDWGTVGRPIYDEILAHFGPQIVEPFSGNMKRQISHCKKMKSMLETSRLKISPFFVDAITGRRNSCASLFIEMQKIEVDLTIGGNVTIKTPRDHTGHCDRAWSAIIGVGPYARQDEVQLEPQDVVIWGPSVYNTGYTTQLQAEEQFLQSKGIYGMVPNLLKM